jgi:hypothetical protein
MSTVAKGMAEAMAVPMMTEVTVMSMAPEMQVDRCIVIAVANSSTMTMAVTPPAMAMATIVHLGNQLARLHYGAGSARRKGRRRGTQ